MVSEIGVMLYNYRMQNAISQKQLAEKIGISKITVYQLERGDYSHKLSDVTRAKLNLFFKTDKF